MEKSEMDWTYRAIGEDIELLTGPAFNSNEFSNSGQGIKLARGINITRGRLRWSESITKYWPTLITGLERFLLKENDIVIGMDGSLVGRNFSLVKETDLPLLLVQRVARVRTRSRLNYIYLFYWISSKHWLSHVDLNKTHSGIPHISSRDISNFKIAFPPIHEQQKIAEVLSTVDRAIEQTEALIAKQQRIKTGLMQDLLTRGIDEHGNIRTEATHEFKDSRLGRIPVEWKILPLGKVIGPIQSGWSPNCDSYPAGADEWAVLKTTAVVWPGYDQHENKRLPSSLLGLESLTVKQDDILITRKGPVERVGVVVHVDNTLAKRMIPDTVFKMRILSDTDVSPSFLPLSLGSTKVQSYWFGMKIGLADAQVNLNHTILRNTLFPKPPIKEQREIVKREKIFKEAQNTLQDSLQKLRALKAALMQDLLTGKKRVTPLLENEPSPTTGSTP
jgi:type I restriction enzyme S subunit